MRETRIGRRNFLVTGAAAAVAPTVLRGQGATAEPVRVGHIGAGTRGWDLLKYTGATPEAKVVAVADVYKPHLKRGLEAGNNPDARGYNDYRELLADPKVEAVVIATPDHWHERMVLDAVAAGKAVYCEKGLTISLEAAKRMRDAVKAKGTVFQLGHQGRQHAATAEAGRLIREGKIGPVTMVKTGRFFNGTREKAPWRWYGYYSHWDHPDPAVVAREVDWERWLGPAPKIDFNERHFWHWRCYWPYGTGQAGDLLSHEMDHVQCVLGWGIPDACSCTGLNAYYDDDREVPDTWLAAYRFEKERCSVTFEGCMNSGRQQPPEYVGKEGRIIFNGIGQDASRFEVYPDGPAYPHMGKMPEVTLSWRAGKEQRWSNHMDDFLSCVRSGKRPRCNIDEAFIEVVTLLMSVESYRRRAEVRWDAKREEFA